MLNAAIASVFDLQNVTGINVPAERISVSGAPSSGDITDPQFRSLKKESAASANSVIGATSEGSNLNHWVAYSRGLNTARHSWPSESSSVGLGWFAVQEYGRLFEKLADFGPQGSRADTVEAGAVKTASKLLGELKSANVYPPLLSWHGGDAIVLIWTLGQKTEAVTVTDEEIGYVLRENMKNIKLLDSVFPQLLMLDKQD